MTPEETRLPMRSHDEALVGNKTEAIDEIYAEDFFNRTPGLPDSMRYGREAVREQYRLLHAAFSDMKITNGDPVVEGDLIGFRWEFEAKHTGLFFGMPATNKTVSIEGYDIIQVRGGKIRAAWIYQDLASLLQQIQPPA